MNKLEVIFKIEIFYIMMLLGDGIDAIWYVLDVLEKFVIITHSINQLYLSSLHIHLSPFNNLMKVVSCNICINLIFIAIIIKFQKD